MKSGPSIVLGITSVISVVLVSLFYNHPMMQTPKIFMALHQHVAALF
jgi:hypothetical protein